MFSITGNHVHFGTCVPSSRTGFCKVYKPSMFGIIPINSFDLHSYKQSVSLDNKVIVGISTPRERGGISTPDCFCQNNYFSQSSKLQFLKHMSSKCVIYTLLYHIAGSNPAHPNRDLTNPNGWSGHESCQSQHRGRCAIKTLVWGDREPLVRQPGVAERRITQLSDLD